MPPVVRFNDVSASYAEQRDEIDAAVAEVIRRGDFINGRDVREFEREFAGYCGAAMAVGCSNGTSALHLALAAAGIGPGDEVIAPAMTFIATTEAVTHCGATLVLADIDARTLNLDAGFAESVATPRTRAVVFVHLHGNSDGIHEARALAERQGLVLIEDCAQAHGALAPEQAGEAGCDGDGSTAIHVGRFGAAGCFSFFPAKNLGAFGDAGALITDDPALAARAHRLANHGRDDKYTHLVEGYNYRLDTLQAAVLRVKLKHLDRQVDRRNELARAYRTRLAGLPLEFQSEAPGGRHALHLFVVETDRRDDLQAHLTRAGIETGIHYPIPLHLQEAYSRLGLREGALPVAEATAKRTLSMPLYPQMPAEHVDAVCDSVVRFFSA